MHSEDDTSPAEASADLSAEVVQNSELLRLSIQMFREQASLQAQLTASRNLATVYEQLVERLKNQTTPNSKEIEQAEWMTTLLAGQVQHTREESRIVELTSQSLADLAVCQLADPVNLSRVDEAAATMMLDSAGQQLAQHATLLQEPVEIKFQDRLASLRALRGLGHASRQEVLEAEQQLLDVKTRMEEGRVNLRRSDLDFQLALVILRWQFSR
jgi:Asp-tRNA(Asn)/Glu-tRNA(Gln) amidotransferase B subunit